MDEANRELERGLITEEVGIGFGVIDIVGFVFGFILLPLLIIFIVTRPGLY